jgi:Ca2+-binding EF-hand superfamily protein
LYNVTSLDSTTVKENFEVTDKNKDGQISFVEVSEDMLEKYMVSQMANMIKRFQVNSKIYYY